MKKFLKNWWNITIGWFLSLVFVNTASARVQVEYGPRFSIRDTMPLIRNVLLLITAIPLIGVIWYYKKGGIKKWPKVVAWISFLLFASVVAWSIFWHFMYF